MPLLTLRDVAKDFAVTGGFFQRRVGAVRALDGVSIDIAAGETWGLVGESGSGKTTLAKIIAGFLAPDGGRVLWEGRPAGDFSRRDWARRVQMVFQDPAASLNPKLSVRTLLWEAVTLKARLDGEKPRAGALGKKVEDLLAAVGLPVDVLPLYPHQFSGGQRQRLAIARALAMEPKLLLADEPVSALDLSVQAQILNLLADLKERFGLTLVLISHDLAVVAHMADKVLVLKQGRAVETGAAADVLARPVDPYTRALLEAVPKFLR